MSDDQNKAATTWQVTSCPAPPYDGAEEYLRTLLKLGWEPFAATSTGSVVKYHLRRKSGRSFHCKRCDGVMPADWPFAVCRDCEMGSGNGSMPPDP